MTLACTILAAIGGLTLLVFITRLFIFLTQYLLSSFSYVRYKGEWAVVTGASAGIGAGFVRELASRGVNVVLLARSKDKMDAIASEVSSAYGVKTHVISFDFGSADSAAYVSLRDELAPLVPKILVNNVGVNVEIPTNFIDMEPKDIDRIVQVNITSVNKMTTMLLPGMVSAAKGVILCLSSGGGAVTPAPLLAPYAGTKAYADAFAVSLSGEVASKGVWVHSLTPFFVESAMAKMRKSLTVPSADDFANKSLNQVGVSPRLSPHWVHSIIAAGLTVLPLKAQVSYVADLHRNIRVRALRKKDRLTKDN